MPTRASAVTAGPSPGATGDPSLQELFTSLQLNIVGQLREHRKDDEARWQREDRRWEEKETADRRTQAAFEARLTNLEERMQVVTAPFQDGHSSVGGGAGPRGGESVPVNSVVNSVLPTHIPAPVSAPAATPLSEPHVLSLGYAVKPTIFDGKNSWEEYRVQFETIARANGWNDQKKATALIASLGGTARSVLTTLSASQCESFTELVSALEFRYGAKNLSNLNYVLFQSHRQRRDESISSLAAKIERLAQSAFADCPAETRDKLAASQFVTALSSSVMQRELRLGGFTSLRAAVTRALEIEAVEAMSRGSSAESRERHSEKRKAKPTDNFGRFPAKQRRSGIPEDQTNEPPRLPKCWLCGKTGHLQKDCFKAKNGQARTGNPTRKPYEGNSKGTA